MIAGMTIIAPVPWAAIVAAVAFMALPAAIASGVFRARESLVAISLVVLVSRVAVVVELTRTRYVDATLPTRSTAPIRVNILASWVVLERGVVSRVGVQTWSAWPLSFTIASLRILVGLFTFLIFG
jgi:hypothetical protein